MKRKLIYTALAILGAACAASAQNTAPLGRVEISDADVKTDGKYVVLSMLIDATDADLRRAEAIVLTPVIESGERRREFPPVVFSGHHRTKADSRAERFGTRTVPYDPDAAITPGAVLYEKRLVTEPWMAGAEVILEQDVYACASKLVSEAYTHLGSLRAEPVKPDINPMIVYVIPVDEGLKHREMSGAAFVDFPVDESKIIADYANNVYELNKIRRMVHDLNADEYVRIHSVSLCGYASPEGTYAHNDRLARRRAEGVRTYLRGEYPQLDSKVTISSVAEDWDGLKLLVEESNPPGRSAILDVIDSGGDPDARERKLKALPAYRELLRDYYPALRRVVCRIEYTVREYTPEECAVIIKTNPERLSQAEMYKLARKYPKNSKEYLQVYETSAKMFPDDRNAEINYAAALLESGKVAEARRYLEKYADDSHAKHNLGVACLLEGDYAEARTYLDQANGTGSVEHAHNLDLLHRLEKYEQEKAAFEAFMK